MPNNIVVHSAPSTGRKSIDDMYKALWIAVIVLAIKDYARDRRWVAKGGLVGKRAAPVDYATAERFLSDQFTYDICGLEMRAEYVISALNSLTPADILKNIRTAYGVGMEGEFDSE